MSARKHRRAGAAALDDPPYAPHTYAPRRPHGWSPVHLRQPDSARLEGTRHPSSLHARAKHAWQPTTACGATREQAAAPPTPVPATVFYRPMLEAAHASRHSERAGPAASRGPPPAFRPAPAPPRALQLVCRFDGEGYAHLYRRRPGKAGTPRGRGGTDAAGAVPYDPVATKRALWQLRQERLAWQLARLRPWMDAAGRGGANGGGSEPVDSQSGSKVQAEETERAHPEQQWLPRVAMLAHVRAPPGVASGGKPEGTSAAPTCGARTLTLDKAQLQATLDRLSQPKQKRPEPAPPEQPPPRCKGGRRGGRTAATVDASLGKTDVEPSAGAAPAVAPAAAPAAEVATGPDEARRARLAKYHGPDADLHAATYVQCLWRGRLLREELWYDRLQRETRPAALSFRRLTMVATASQAIAQSPHSARKSTESYALTSPDQ